MCRPLGTGTDGLQEVCSKAIFFALPWTYELKKQSEARIIRNGQERDCEIITLEAFYMIDNPKIIAAIIATIIGIISRSIIATIFSGLASYWFLIFVI